MNLESLLEAVSELAAGAGRIALSHYRTGIRVEDKADGSPVTAADRAAEEWVRAWIAKRFPEDGIVGEEFGDTRPGARRTWYIDPIDGTRTFVSGVPLWGSLVAVCEGDRVLAGAAAFPAVSESVAAAAGQGCWANGARCTVSSVASLKDATVLTTDSRFVHAPARRSGWDTLAARARNARTWGDCYGYLLVATGRAEVMVDGTMSPWDAAALAPIVTEAGGVFVDFNGRPTAFGDGTIATNALLAREAHELLGVRNG